MQIQWGMMEALEDDPKEGLGGMKLSQRDKARMSRGLGRGDKPKIMMG